MEESKPPEYPLIEGGLSQKPLVPRKAKRLIIGMSYYEALVVTARECS